MKRICALSLSLTLILCTISCQENSLDKGQNLDQSLKITATIVPPAASRVTYEVDNVTTFTIQPTWTKDDKVFGFDSEGNQFTFTVSSVSEGRATLTSDAPYTPDNDVTLYAIYAPGYDVGDLDDTDANNQTLAVNLTAQDGKLDATAPFLMCATATVSGGSVNLSFEYQAAIVGIKKFKINPVSAETTVNQLVLNGAVAAGTFQIVNTKLQLVPSGSPAPITAAGPWRTDENGVYNTPVYFAVLPTTNANLELHAVAGSDKYVNLASITGSNLAAGSYYHMAKILDAVADVAGVKYDSIAAAWEAAKSASTDVTITLLANCTHNSQIDFGNANDKTITLDLNGKVLTTETAKFITSASSSKSLIIKDTGSPKGKITSSAANIIYLTKPSLSVELDGSIIESSMAASEDNADAALYVKAENTPRPQITLDNGARVYTKNAVTTIYSNYGVYTLNECEITSGSAKTGGRYCIFASTGAQIEVNEDASLYSTETSGTFSAIHSGSGNSATSIVINGGHFYGKYSLTAGNSGGYSSRMTINGGYFVNDISSYSGSSRATINGSIGVSSESHTHQTTGDTNIYEYMCSVASVNGVNYEGLAEAVSAANSTNEPATLKILGDIEHNSKIDLSNEHNQPITLDLNGFTLSTSTMDFITTTKSLEITDTGESKGAITSNKENIIVNNGGEVTLKGITASSTITKFTGSYIYSTAAVRNTGGGTMTISNSILYTTKELAVINNTGTGSSLTISNSEVSASTAGTGGCAVTSGTGASLTINSGQFYNEASSGARPTIYYTGAAATPSPVIIKGGYFNNADENGRCVRASTVSYTQYIEITAGYFNRALSGYSATTGHAPKITTGSQTTVLTGEDIVHMDNTILGSPLSYTIQVSGAGGAEAQASTGSVVASYGTAKTGISF